MYNMRRITPMREWRLLTRQYFLMLLSAKKDLLISLAFPVIAALITVWIAGKNMFVHFEGTKSACFVLVSAAIWGGMFNSIQTIVKERANIHRDYLSGLRLRTYTASRAFLQFFLCAIQSLILCIGIWGVNLKYGNDLPAEGVFGGSAMFEFYISLLLLMYAADAMGLFCSCLVKKSETASVLAPYILIVQLIFSGILFKMEGAAEAVSYVMLSRWGMEAMGSISNLNDMTMEMQLQFPASEHTADDMFTYTTGHLAAVWLILILFALGFIIIGNAALHRISKDTR